LQRILKNNGDSGGAVDQEHGGRKDVVGGKARRSGGTAVEQPLITIALGRGSTEVLKIMKTAARLSTRNTGVRKLS
jgi:hypothetical protein